MLFAGIGEQGQRRLGAGRVTLIGCGGLGTVLADVLVRAGVGFLRIVDRDFVELNNLQRQVLFDEQDAADGLPKSVAAARRLAEINSTAAVEPIVADVTAANIESFVESADVVLDGVDNFETRFLINDVAVKLRRPWVYGACIASEGMVAPIVPGETACLRCLLGDAPAPGSAPTCDTVGILSPVVHVVAALQTAEAIKILIGRPDLLNRRLLRVDTWTGELRYIEMRPSTTGPACPCCQGGVFDYLSARPVETAVTLCGRQAVQISPVGRGTVDFSEVAARISAVAKPPPRFNRYLLRFEADGCRVTLFPDGRAIIQGTTDAAVARSIYAKYVGM